MVQPNLPSFPPSSLPPFLLDEITSRPLHPAQLSIRNIHGDIDRLSNLTRPIIDPSLRLHSFRDRIICYRAISRPDSSRPVSLNHRFAISSVSRREKFLSSSFLNRVESIEICLLVAKLTVRRMYVLKIFGVDNEASFESERNVWYG